MQGMQIESQLPAANNNVSVALRARRNGMASKAARLDRELKGLPLAERLKYLRGEISGKIVLTTGFGMESQVILHHIAEHGIDIGITTLDTGRLFPETYKLWEDTERRYGLRIRAVYPRAESVSDFIDEHGINGFYASKDARLSCCHVRKVEPLKRALAGVSAWLTGVRGSQSSLRAGARFATANDEHKLIKVNPLFDWSRDAVLDFVRAHDVPINALHEQGFASIGCAPCTRAIRPGEDERAGRWWWEADGKTECGLHVSPARAAVAAAG
jgi:phosphoadenosine phosphosulfate reductase